MSLSDTPPYQHETGDDDAEYPMPAALTRTHDRVNAIGVPIVHNPIQAARNEAVNEVLAIIEAEIADQECAVELLHDLVMLLNEQAATGGGPNYYARWRTAFQRAETFLGLDDTND